MAKGFNVRSMVSEVGMVEGRLKGSNNYAVKDLAQQERGGSIKGRSFIPISVGARIGKSYGKNVRKAQRISTVNNLVKAKKANGKTKGQRFIQSAEKAGIGGRLLTEKTRGKQFIFEIRGIKNSGKNRIKAVPIYSYIKGRSVKVQPTKFMERSGDISGRQMDKFYQQEGQKQINRLMAR